MEINLFQKYNKVIEKKNSEKKIIIECIHLETGALFLDEEIVIKKKTLIFHISSAKKTIFQNKNLVAALKKEGYTILF